MTTPIRKVAALMSIFAVTRAATLDHSPMSPETAGDLAELVQDARGPVGSGGSKIVCILCMAGGIVAGAGSIAGLLALALAAPGPVFACAAACYSAFS